MTGIEAFEKIIKKFVLIVNMKEQEELKELYNIVLSGLKRLEQLDQIWNSEEWCKPLPLNVDTLKSLFKYNLDLFNENLELDKKNLDLEKENQEFKRYKEQWSSDTHIWIEDNIGKLQALDKEKDLYAYMYELPIFDNLLANVDKLLYENQVLRARCKALPPLVIKNEKLEKTIDILQRFNFKLDHLPNGEYCIYIYHSGIEIRIILTEEEYELLKEVLE